MADLEHLAIENVGDVLREWRRTLDQADEMYDGFNLSMRRWIDVNGGDFMAIVPALAMLRPDERQLARSVIDDSVRTIERTRARLSHPVDTFDHAAEDSVARAKSGGAEMDIKAEVDTLKQRVSEIEEWNTQLADVLRRRTEELREATGRLDLAERRFAKLLDRHEELEQYAANQLAVEVTDLRKAVRGIGIVASGLEPRPVQVHQ